MRHATLLKKYIANYETQQKVIEAALDSLDNNQRPMPALSHDEELWLMIGRARAACAIQKEGYRIMLETVDIERFREYVSRQKPVEFVIEYYCHKPLGECSLVEIMDALVINCRVSNLVDTIDFTDDGDHYTLKMTHDLGINNSIMLTIVHESLFTSYGVKSTCSASERSLFIKVFKNS